MTTARSRQICLEHTPWYHCMTRCVRRAFICGYDALTNRDYSHRKVWIEDRIEFLASVFCIDIGGYAIMSNHYHLVLKIDAEGANALSDKEVVSRWLKMYSGNGPAKRFLADEALSDDEKVLLAVDIAKWRKELSNISRFMAELNQKIARRANLEDDCRGKFWESRFDSQAILDVDALLRTLIYVDLNPVRAKVTDKPEESNYTSLSQRLRRSSFALIPFKIKSTVNSKSALWDPCIPIAFEDYLTLLDWTGREIRDDKRGSIASNEPPILKRLNYSIEQWINSQQPVVRWRQKALGTIENIQRYCDLLDRRWIWQAKEHVIGE